MRLEIQLDNTSNTAQGASPGPIGVTSATTNMTPAERFMDGPINRGIGEWMVNLTSDVLKNLSQSLQVQSLHLHGPIHDSGDFWITNILNPTTDEFFTDIEDITNTTGATPGMHEERSAWSTILSLVIMITTCVLIIIGNLTVLIVFHYTPALNNASGIFIKSLACADLGVGICCSFSVHSWFLQEWPYGMLSCAMIGYILAVAVGVSIIGLACLSLDRYVAIKKPLKYCTILTKPRARWIVIGVWGASAGLFMPSLFGWGAFHYNDHSYECSLHWEQNVAFSFFIISVLVIPALAISTFCYIHILKACFDQNQQIERTEMMFKSQNRESQRTSYERLLAKIFLIIMSAFYVTWLPFVITKTLRGLVNIEIPPLAMFIFSWLGILNSFLNCVVYSIGHKSFRRGFFLVLRKIRRSAQSIFNRTSNNIRKKRRKTKIHLNLNDHQRIIDARAIAMPVRESSL